MTPPLPSPTVEKRVVDPADLYRAVKYMLDRIQDSPNVRYYCGPGTQMFLELIRAEAAWTGCPVAEVEAQRKVDTEPSYRKTRPRIIELEERLSDARQHCTCGGVE